VTKIIIENRNGKPTAVGVQYTQDGVTKIAKANKEVIISGSAILTPKLLQLSGIGPAALLKKFNIPVIVNNSNVGLNVGNNMLTPGRWEYPNATNPNEWFISADAQQYGLNGTGPIAYPANFGFAFACSQTPCAEPDVMIGSGAGIYESGTITPTISLNVEPALAKSRGILTISSADPNAPPNLNFPIFQNPADINSTIYGLQLLRRIKNTYPATLVFGRELQPGPSVQTYEEYYNFVTTSAIFSAHWVGSCKIGNYGDPTAVVDPRLRVFGVKNLRIGDGSILPQLNSHASASIVMVGERAAAFILEDWADK